MPLPRRLVIASVTTLALLALAAGPAMAQKAQLLVYTALETDQLKAYQEGFNKVSATGQLVTSSGQPLQPAITIPPTAQSLTIGRDGTVSAELFGGGAATLGQIQIARFLNPAGLTPVGQNLMKETPASGAPVAANPGQNGAGALMQGTLEASNVNVVEEMVNMIETQRAYEINSKAISAVDGMLKYMNQNM